VNTLQFGYSPAFERFTRATMHFQTARLRAQQVNREWLEAHTQWREWELAATRCAIRGLDQADARAWAERAFQRLERLGEECTSTTASLAMAASATRAERAWQSNSVRA
jgi:hypothetical protein